MNKITKFGLLILITILFNVIVFDNVSYFNDIYIWIFLSIDVMLIIMIYYVGLSNV